MRRLFEKKGNAAQDGKRQITVIGTLLSILRPGLPVMYDYMGSTIRTSNVVQILEASPSHVTFETENSIYRISFETVAAVGF